MLQNVKKIYLFSLIITFYIFSMFIVVKNLKIMRIPQTEFSNVENIY